METEQVQSPPVASVTLAEIVRSPEWELVERTVRAELHGYLGQITRLDPFDEKHGQKAVALSAKIYALKSLARRFYREAGLNEMEAEDRLTGGKSFS